MRVLALPIVLALSSTMVVAQPHTEPAKCAIGYNASDTLTETIKSEQFAFEGFNKLCETLRKEQLQIFVTSSSGVLEQRAYGWVTVTLGRLSNGVLGTISQSSTTLSKKSDSPEAKRLMMESLNKALQVIARDPSSYVESVVIEEIRLRQTLAGNGLQHKLAHSAEH